MGWDGDEWQEMTENRPNELDSTLELVYLTILFEFSLIILQYLYIYH